MLLRILAVLFILNLPSLPQSATLTLAPRVELPPVIDGNSAAFWADGQMYLFHSTGVPHISSGPDQFHLSNTRKVEFDSPDHNPVWFEAVWRDDDGTLFLFYHHEPEQRCEGSNLTAPKIGAAISRDNGATVQDLGIVLESGDPIDCASLNGFFSGGHGDASVILDKDRHYFYFFFTNYAGPTASQGVSTARMAFEDRFSPVGKVHKFHEGEWIEPGLGGKVSPIYPANRSWQAEDTDSHWGPSIHYNTHIDKYVILLNRSCCNPGWPQAGIDITFNADLADPYAWRPLQRILNNTDIIRYPGYYPQVLGLEEGHSDNRAGHTARLYLMGLSDWEITFNLEDAPSESENLPCSNPDIPCQASIRPKRR
jgi:hypothetical protein